MTAVFERGMPAAGYPPGAITSGQSARSGQKPTVRAASGDTCDGLTRIDRAR